MSKGSRSRALWSRSARSGSAESPDPAGGTPRGRSTGNGVDRVDTTETGGRAREGAGTVPGPSLSGWSTAGPGTPGALTCASAGSVSGAVPGPAGWADWAGSSVLFGGIGTDGTGAGARRRSAGAGMRGTPIDGDRRGSGSSGLPSEASGALSIGVIDHSWTSSISVPNAPLGCTNATVVPRDPGRGAWSMTWPPWSLTDWRATPQSATR
jgi:hypothetical protein